MSVNEITEEEFGTQFIRWLLSRPYYLGGILSGIIVYVIYVLLAEWSYYFVLPPEKNAVFWFPSGVTAALFIRGRWNPKIWPFWLCALFFGEFYSLNYHGAPLLTTFIWSCSNLVLPFTIALLARKYVKGHFDFCSLRDVLCFFGIVTLGVVPSCFLGGIGSVIGYKTNFFVSAISWGLSDALGIFLITPVILSWTSKPPHQQGKGMEGFMLFLLLTASAMMVFYFSEKEILHWSFFSFLIFFVAWASIRFGPRGTSLTLLAFDLVEVAVTTKGFGTFDDIGLTASERLFTLQVLVANIGFLMFILAAAIEEQSAARLSAEEAIEMRDEFLSVAAHELKNPLSSLTMQVQIMNRYMTQNQPETLDPEKIKGYADMSERQLKRFSRLINELLDITKIKAGKLKIECAEVNLSELVKETIGQFRTDLEKNKCEVKVEVRDNIIIYADKLRIEQMLINLLSNASKYGAGKPIEIRAEVQQDFVHLSVIDHGIGIAPENQDRIFERFERAVTNREFKGLGLGLYITRQIVEGHGGHIHVESQMGEGSSFIVDLPVKGICEERVLH